MRSRPALTRGLAWLASCAALWAGCAKVSKADVLAAIESNPDVILRVLEKHKDRVAKILIDFDDDKVSDKLADEKLDKDIESPATSTQRYTPELEAGRPQLGPKDAPIAVVVYSDFECPYCAEAAESVSQLLKKYPTQVRFFFKHMPGSSHVGARPASRFFEALARQGAQHAFAFHDRAFKEQDKLDALGAQDAAAHEAFFKKLALEVAPDKARFEADLKRPDADARIARDEAEAARFQFDSTPRFLINGELIDGAASVEELEVLVRKHLKPAAPPAAKR